MRRNLFYLFAAAIMMVACDLDGNDLEKPGNSVAINGVRWATTNLDAPGKFAAKPEDYGMFYQWGKNVGWSATDPLVSSNGDTTWDNSVVTGEVWASFYDPCPDGWRVPGREDFQALTDGSKVVSTWTKQGGVNGRLFVDLATEKAIFLPAAGYRYKNGSAYDQGTYGDYWSSTAGSSTLGHYMHLGSSSVNPSHGSYEVYGFSVRCVHE